MGTDILSSIAGSGRNSLKSDDAAIPSAIASGDVDYISTALNISPAEARALRDGFSNKRILNNGDVTVGGYKNISLDVEKGGSGKVNIHLQVDGKKYFYDSKTGTYTSKDGASLPSSIAKNPKIQIATKKAREYGKKIQGK